MNVNVPVLALSVVGLLVAAYGIFIQGSIFWITGGLGIILFAWVLQEMAKRRT